MSIQIHTDDPISPTKDSGMAPRITDADARDPSNPRGTTTTFAKTYPSAQPGAAAPTPTSSTPQSSNYGPPAPQPGGAPVAAPPAVTARPSVPPPPKAGEKPLSPEQYAPMQSTAVQPQPYPPQMSQSLVDEPLKALPPGSTTSTSTQPSFNPSAPPSSIPSSTEAPRPRASLEHPPGYVQNPFASDMTPDQRFAAEQGQGDRNGTLPSLGYTDNAKGPRPGLEDDQTVFGQAKQWIKEAGGQAGKQAEELWNKFSADK